MTMPDSGSNISSSDGCEEISCQGYTGDGALIMIKLQDVTDEGNVSNTAVEVIDVLNMFDHERKYSVWIGGSALLSLSTFQQWTTKHHEV